MKEIKLPTSAPVPAKRARLETAGTSAGKKARLETAGTSAGNRNVAYTRKVPPMNFPANIFAVPQPGQKVTTPDKIYCRYVFL